MKITVAGTGYVGLVTGVCLAEVGHDVTCVDVDENKVKLMESGVSPIYEEAAGGIDAEEFRSGQTSLYHGLRKRL